VQPYVRGEDVEREMVGSGKMERTLKVITKSKSILMHLLGQFIRPGCSRT
jgi:hypothetical protein